jgi:hypothetical protein
MTQYETITIVLLVIRTFAALFALRRSVKQSNKE